MPPEDHVDLAHAEAADWVLGTLGPAEAEAFGRHLARCPHCQATVAEFGQLGRMLQHLPPAVEPPADLEARTLTRVREAAAIARLLAAPADDQATTEVPQVPQAPPRADAGTPPPADAGTPPPAGAGTKATVIPFPRRPGHLGLLAIAVAVAAAVIAAVVIVPKAGRGAPPVVATINLGSLSRQAGSGVATVRPDASGSFDITLRVQHLRKLGKGHFYECWYLGSGPHAHPQLVSAGTFTVGTSGSGTFPMTSAADPHRFRTMEITTDNPGDAGKPGRLIMRGTAST